MSINLKNIAGQDGFPNDNTYIDDHGGKALTETTKRK